MLKRIEAGEVRLGMYIAGFEGSWLQHPFWWAKFVVKTDKKLARLRNGSVGVIIDTSKGEDLPPVERPRAAPAPVAHLSPMQPAQKFAAPRMAVEPAPYIRQASAPARVQAPTAFGKADKVRATALAQRSTEVVKALFSDCQLGRAIPTAKILSVVDDIASTLELNSGAFLNVTRLKSKNDASYTHSIAVCALMIGLARELGLPPGEVQALGTAGLLHDVGKVSLDEALLRKVDDLNEAERIELRRHPELGHEALSKEAGLPPVALDVCLHHHERRDGSGYPFGLAGDQVSRAARMAAICDTYESMTSNGPMGGQLAPADAVAAIQAQEGAFDTSLLFKFMRSIGVFPAGTLVRLRSNRLAMVLPSAGDDRRPLVRAFYSTAETRFITYADAVLSESLTDDQAISEERADRWFREDWGVMCADILRSKALAPARATAA